jgi:UDP-N-acetylmuramate--alanine ligase
LFGQPRVDAACRRDDSDPHVLFGHCRSRLLSAFDAPYSVDSMKASTPYFFCGIGGSGMLPLALIMKARGHDVAGSDRALDQGRVGQKFEFLSNQGIRLYPQDGSGVTRAGVTVVTSTAVEETVPDVVAARRVGAPLVKRADLLAQLFNAAPVAIGVAGTSGKSTTTGMIAWILEATGRSPTVMNGAVMKNFVDAKTPFASSVVGKGDIFVSEVDESDGSIALYRPRIAVLNNIALDHKSLAELRELFADFIAKAETSVINLDNDETVRLAERRPRDAIVSYSLEDEGADLFATSIGVEPDGIAFELKFRGRAIGTVRLRVPGRHNAANALAAIGASYAAGVPLEEARDALGGFQGIRRRLEYVGTANSVIVIDDFAHNPDKIAATLSTLHDFPGRLLVMFQPHGFGPLRLMREGFIDTFARALAKDDVLIMPEPVYFGGTVTRDVTSLDIVEGVRAQDRSAFAFADRTQCGEKLVELASPGDRIVVMGARDDTLSLFAAGLVERLKAKKMPVK